MINSNNIIRLTARSLLFFLLLRFTLTSLLRIFKYHIYKSGVYKYYHYYFTIKLNFILMLSEIEEQEKSILHMFIVNS